MNTTVKRAQLRFARARISLDQIWILVLLVLAWIFVALAPLPPNDLWWHMAAGRIMVEEGALITTNRWAYTLPADAPYVYQSWLSELLMYGAWHIGGVPLLALLRIVAIVGAYTLVAWHALRRTASGRAVALALLSAMLIGWNNWTLRPQTLAFLPGAAFVVLLGEYLDGRLRARALAALPLLMLLWVNMHGSFVLGAIMLALAWLSTAWAAGRTRDRMQFSRLRALTVAGFATLLAVLCNPLGLGIFGYLQMMLGNEILQRSFVEWQPPRNSLSDFTGFWFYVMLFGLALLLASFQRRPQAFDLLWFTALGWLAVGGVRYAVWFALFLLPLLADRLSSLLPARRIVPASSLFSGIILGASALALMMTLPWFQPQRALGLSSPFATVGPDGYLLGATTPISATTWLADNPQPGRFWTNMTYSSYTIWELPTTQVFADLRVELFPPAIWQQYFSISRGQSEALSLIDRWQIGHLLLDLEADAELHALLIANPSWCERYRDERSVIVARCP